ncbi:g832 [Coccomyxa viridis]|uniref:G832 protein n=1 Tax=Coccomyxa viridis TaxID=1274662 RepID=A0ABP1FGM0_9CHLO
MDILRTKATQSRGFQMASEALSPLLPSLLAACTSSAKLILIVYPIQGERFLAVGSGDKPLRANPELLSFSANLRQHLTELTMWMDNSKGIPRRLGALGKLTKPRSHL